MVRKEEVIEKNLDVITEHFSQYNQIIRIPVIFEQQVSSVFNGGSWGTPTVMPTVMYECCDITYEDFVNHTKRKEYQESFDKMVNE